MFLPTERTVVSVAATISTLRTPNAVACAGLSVGHGRPVLAGLDLAVGPGETLALLGSSGSGKTTLLNAIAGFAAPLAGQIWLAGELVSGPGRLMPPERRRVGMVFQDHALWPHLSVLDTVAYPLRRSGASRAAARRDAQAILEQMGLGPLAGRRPGQLSGGEQQRVGLARALAAAPGLYLFDEPTAHLDANLRAQILDEVARRRAADGAAAIYATHDATEALAIADRVAVLHSGAAGPGRPARRGLFRAGRPDRRPADRPGFRPGRPGAPGRTRPVRDRNRRGASHRARHRGETHRPSRPRDPGSPRLGPPGRGRPTRQRHRSPVPRPAHRLSPDHAGRAAPDPGAWTSPHRPRPGVLVPGAPPAAAPARANRLIFAAGSGWLRRAALCDR